MKKEAILCLTLTLLILPFSSALELTLTLNDGESLNMKDYPYTSVFEKYLTYGGGPSKLTMPGLGGSNEETWAEKIWIEKKPFNFGIPVESYYALWSMQTTVEVKKGGSGFSWRILLDANRENTIDNYKKDQLLILPGDGEEVYLSGSCNGISTDATFKRYDGASWFIAKGKVTINATDLCEGTSICGDGKDCCTKYEAFSGYGWVKGNCELDSDSDGILNDEDNCPNTPNGPMRGTCINTVTGEKGKTKVGEDWCYVSEQEDLDDCTALKKENGETDWEGGEKCLKDLTDQICDRGVSPEWYTCINKQTDHDTDTDEGLVCEKGGKGTVELKSLKIKIPNTEDVTLQDLIEYGATSIDLQSSENIIIGDSITLELTAPESEELTVESLKFDKIIMEIDAVGEKLDEIGKGMYRTTVEITSLEVTLDESMTVEKGSTETITIDLEQITMEAIKITISIAGTLSDLQKEAIESACSLIPELSPETIKAAISNDPGSELELTDIDDVKGESGKSPCKAEVRINQDFESGKKLCLLTTQEDGQEESYDGKLISIQYLEIGDPIEEEILNGQLKKDDYSSTQFTWETTPPEPTSDNDWIKCSVEVNGRDVESEKMRYCKKGKRPFKNNGCNTVKGLIDSLSDDPFPESGLPTLDRIKDSGLDEKEYTQLERILTDVDGVINA